MTETVVRLKPLTYVHIHDGNSNISTILCGPATYTLPQHQSLLTKEPQNFVVVPPQNYAVIDDPMMRDPKTNEILKDKHGQVKINLGEKEIRFAQLPFPLYPGESLDHVRKLQTLEPTQALVLRANRKFTGKTQEDKDVAREAGDEYLYFGPGTYIPRIEEDIVERRDAIVVKYNESLKLRAKNKFTDSQGIARTVGEEYIWSKAGSYMLGVDETLVSVIPAVSLTEKKAIHVEVIKGYKDTRPWAKGAERQAGQFFMVTSLETSEFTPLPYERIFKEVPLIVISKKQWAVLQDPFENGATQLGRRKVVTDTSLFLQPGEKLPYGVKDVYVLCEDEALLLTATEEFMDNDVNPPVKRVAGELWLLSGPREYFPPATVEVKKNRDGGEKRKRLVLPENDGVYVKNIQTGETRLVTGCTYMLTATEELWEKDIPAVVEEKLARQGTTHSAYLDKGTTMEGRRDKTRAVKYIIPNNAVTQVYDYKKRTQRTLFGPNCVMLGPDEQFTVLSLSGSPWDPKRPYTCLPKQTGFIKALYLFLGPSNMSDVLKVDTLDHAQLSLQLSYDWYFDVQNGSCEQADYCFKIPDFIGDCCSCIASRIRASIAGVPFETFHKHSSSIVAAAVFGLDKETKLPKTELHFPSNRLIVTSVDIQEIEVLDPRTRTALEDSVKMAIEITTQAQENVAKQKASVLEQQARGKLERQIIEDKASNEVEKKRLYEHETTTAAIGATGQAKAEAKARAEAAAIEGDTSVAVAKINAQTRTAMDKVQQEVKLQKACGDLDYQAEKDTSEVSRMKALAEIESGKFKRTMDAIGKNTVAELARAGPEMQAKILKSMGLEGYLVTDGTNPINLFNTAQGMTAQPGHKDPNAK